jgi:hypothetical protein
MSDDGFLSFEEEIALAAPLTLDKDQAGVCDRRGCQQRATQIIPGCVLCPDCASEFGIGRRDTYHVPLEELAITDWRIIRARCDEYEALLAERRERRLVRSTPANEALLSEAIRCHVDDFIRSAGCTP